MIAAFNQCFSCKLRRFWHIAYKLEKKKNEKWRNEKGAKTYQHRIHNNQNSDDALLFMSKFLENRAEFGYLSYHWNIFFSLFRLLFIYIIYFMRAEEMERKAPNFLFYWNSEVWTYICIHFVCRFQNEWIGKKIYKNEHYIRKRNLNKNICIAFQCHTNRTNIAAYTKHIWKIVYKYWCSEKLHINVRYEYKTTKNARTKQKQKKRVNENIKKLKK